MQKLLCFYIRNMKNMLRMELLIQLLKSCMKLEELVIGIKEKKGKKNNKENI